MKKLLITSIAVAVAAFALLARLDDDLAATGFVHAPLSADATRSLEAEAAAKRVLARKVLHSAEMPGLWHGRGEGSVSTLPGDSVPSLCVDVDTRGRRAVGPADDPDYALYGHAVAVLDLEEVSLDDFNRIEIDIEPECPGNRAVSINLTIDNSTGAVGDGYNPPTGAHLIILDNFRLNRCFLEIADLKRDALSRLSLSFSINGAAADAPGGARFRIVRVEAQRVASVEKISGWSLEPGRIVYSMSGYAADGAKTAIMSPGTSFRVVDDSTGKIAFRSRAERTSTGIGEFGVADFSSLHKPGKYRIVTDSSETEPFTIADDAGLWQPSVWKVLNFIFCQRCGYSVPGIHPMCHLDLMSDHNGQRRTFAGGWHDAGDLSQQTLQTADVAFALLELYDTKKNSNPLLASRLREEALWGIEFMLRNRLGGGYHASSMGLLIWQDGIFGTDDDITSVRVQNVAYDNYLYAAVEAYAARVLADFDDTLSEKLCRCAREDYEFAEKRFESDGFGGWINPYEHTFCTSESLHMATASWAASMLYELTGEESYAADAARRADYVLACQQCEPVGGLSGFFYRNLDRCSVVHFIHQSREQIFMQALAALCSGQPDHPDRGRWTSAMRLYGDYIKNLMQYTAPYGMIPAGIYRDDEPDDEQAFFALHLFPPSDARERFSRQARGGVEVAKGYFVKRFPVWFNIFNGNLAIHTSMGKAAAICARCLGDADLLDIAREQLYWTVGKNPFAQSLIYGEGHRYPELNNFSTGRLTGAMPVGIRSLADTDEPYWPQINNACYKEVWLTSAGKWLSLLAETENYNKKS